MSSSMSEAALKLEIARLSGAIDRFKNAASNNPTDPPRNAYINPNYKPPSRSTVPVTPTGPPWQTENPEASTSKVREIIIGGVAFQSSRRKLVRADLPKPPPSQPISSSNTPGAGTSRLKSGHLLPVGRTYKPKSRRGRPGNRNMTLNNNRRPYLARRLQRKYVDKSCPRFSTTGTCTRGLTCMYQHDPAKIAVCWNFLQGQCPNTAETCNLSHDPTPERTPLCMHFANNGRCTRDNCLFPHVRVGARQGICRDFAVLGYCAKGLDCDKQHVKECPDFADKGSCSTKGCKLPHVIRANRTRKAAATTSADDSSSSRLPAASAPAETDNNSGLPQVTAEDAQLGDEYISLTFLESEEDDEEDEDEAESDDPADEEGRADVEE